MSIEVRSVTKRFGSFEALRDVNLKVETGELVALLGPSGSGKTTLLRIIAGMEAADSGQVLFNGQNSSDGGSNFGDTGDTDRSTASPPNENDDGIAPQVGFVFQHYALFRHMTVFENIAFGLRVRPRRLRPAKAEIRDRVNHLIRLVQLEGLAKRFPAQLSGGQRQRVALARALAVEPKVLLLDEPFGALDAKVRQELRRWLRHLHDEIHITSVFVTHDQEEALEVANRVVIMNEGRIEQFGTPEEVYDHPATPFVYGFLGSVNLFHGRLREGHLRFGAPDDDAGEPAAVAYVRPHDLDIERSPNGSESVPAVIRHSFPVGSVVKVELERSDGGHLLEAELPKQRYLDLGLKKGDQVYVVPRRVKVFEEDFSI